MTDKRDVRNLCSLVNDLTTEVLVAWSYVDPLRRPTDRASQLVQRAKEITRRVLDELPPPPELTEDEKQRAHETIVAALNRREWRNGLTPADIGMVPVDQLDDVRWQGGQMAVVDPDTGQEHLLWRERSAR